MFSLNSHAGVKYQRSSSDRLRACRLESLFDLAPDAGLIDASVADGDAEYLCAFQRITGDYYYLDYTLPEVRDEYMDAYLNSQSILENLDGAFNGRILLYAPSGNRHELLYASESFAEYTALEDMGIDPDLPTQSFATVTLGNTKYFYTLSDPVMTIDGSSPPVRT